MTVSFEPDDYSLLYKDHQLKVLRNFYENKISGYYLNKYSNVKPGDKIAIYTPTIPWETELFQRPHQIFRELAKHGYKAFFITPDYEKDMAYPIREVEKNLFVVKDTGILTCSKKRRGI